SAALAFTGAASPASAVSREKSGRPSDAARAIGGRTLIETLRQEDLSDSLVPTGLDAATELAGGAGEYAPLYMPNRTDTPERRDAAGEAVGRPGASPSNQSSSGLRLPPERRANRRDDGIRDTR